MLSVKFITRVLLLLSLFSCKESHKQYPINYLPTTDGFMSYSKEKNLLLLGTQNKIISNYIQSKKEREFSKTDAGFWMSKVDSINNNRFFAKNGDEVVYTFNIFSLKDSLLYSKKTIGKRIEVLGKVDVFPGMYFALQKLSVGEKASFIFPSSMAFGFNGDNGNVKPAMPILIDLEMININKK